MGAWELTIVVLVCGAGLSFWPVFQLLHRRRSPCSKRLAIVFFVTLGVLTGYGVLLVSTWRGHQWLPLLLLFPLLNLISLLVSTVVCLVSPKRYDTAA
jgi:hypothetical protein